MVSHVVWVILHEISIHRLFILEQSIQLEEVSFDICRKLVHQVPRNQRPASRSPRWAWVLPFERQVFLGDASTNTRGQPVFIIWQLLNQLLLILFINLVLHGDSREVALDGMAVCGRVFIVNGLNTCVGLNRNHTLAFQGLTFDHFGCAVQLRSLIVRRYRALIPFSGSRWIDLRSSRGCLCILELYSDIIPLSRSFLHDFSLFNDLLLWQDVLLLIADSEQKVL